MIEPITGASLINIFSKIRFRAFEFALYAADQFTVYIYNIYENYLLPCNKHITKMCQINICMNTNLFYHLRVKVCLLKGTANTECSTLNEVCKEEADSPALSMPQHKLK